MAYLLVFLVSIVVIIVFFGGFLFGMKLADFIDSQTRDVQLYIWGGFFVVCVLAMATVIVWSMGYTFGEF